MATCLKALYASTIVLVVVALCGAGPQPGWRLRAKNGVKMAFRSARMPLADTESPAAKLDIEGSFAFFGVISCGPVKEGGLRIPVKVWCCCVQYDSQGEIKAMAGSLGLETMVVEPESGWVKWTDSYAGSLRKKPVLEDGLITGFKDEKVGPLDGVVWCGHSIELYAEKGKTKRSLTLRLRIGAPIAAGRAREAGIKLDPVALKGPVGSERLGSQGIGPWSELGPYMAFQEEWDVAYELYLSKPGEADGEGHASRQ